MEIVIKNLQKKIRINQAKIKQIAHKVSCPARGEARQGRPAKFNNLELRLYFVRNCTIKKLNRQFFAKNCLTDVISFLLNKNYAEVFIAPSVVKINSNRFKVGLEEELYRCVVHGILHVVGYKDASGKDRSRMWKRQEKILKEFLAKK